MDDEIDPLLVYRYITGEGTQAERDQVAGWVGTDASRRAEVERYRRLIEQWGAEQWGAGRPGGSRAPRMLDRLHRAMDRETMRPGPRRFVSVDEPAGHEALWRRARIAAAFLLVTLGSLVAWRAGWLTPGQQFRQFASARGGRTTITLHDGTQIVLGPGSTLRVPGRFGATTRAVELDGEALFTVVHDARRPFAVRLVHGVVRDIGTTFVVRAYADDNIERVAVAEGEVAIADVALRAHDGAAIDARGAVHLERGVDLSREMAWVQGGLRFQDTPLRDVVRDVARVYDIDVTIADTSLATRPITASFHGQPIDEVLDVIVFAIGAHYERSGRSIVIQSGSAPTAHPARGAAVRSTRST